MSFLKMLMAFSLMIIIASMMKTIPPDSKEFFLGCCLILAGFVAHPDVRR